MVTAEKAESPTPIFEAIPVESVMEEAPKRRRGRPPKDPNAPKRTYRKRTANLETRVGGLVARVNIGFAIAAAFLPGIHPDDPLSPVEIERLAKALTEQANAHPTFRRYLEYAASASDSSDLLFVVGAIAVRRLSNHGIVPETVGTMASLALENPEALATQIVAEMSDESEPAGIEVPA